MNKIIRPAHVFTNAVYERFFPSQAITPGFILSWKKTEDRLKWRPGELTIWGGYNGHGKSLFLNQLMLDAIGQGERVLIASFEMRADRTLYRMVRQATGQSTPSEPEIAACLEWLGESIWIYDHIGQSDTDKMLRFFSEAIKNLRISQIVIDSLMKCGMAEDDYNGQKCLVDRLQNLCQSSNVHAHVVAHPRKGIDEYQIPGKMDVMGTGSITNMADNVFTVWRNKRKSDYLELYEAGETLPSKLNIHDVKKMYDGVLYCSKCREDCDAEGKYGYFYNKSSMQFQETDGITSNCYFDFDSYQPAGY